MANRDCNGEFFTADGVRYYCCLWDGAVLYAPPHGSKCLNCEREIAANDCGDLSVRTRREVTLPNGWVATLP